MGEVKTHVQNKKEKENCKSVRASKQVKCIILWDDSVAEPEEDFAQDVDDDYMLHAFIATNYILNRSQQSSGYVANYISDDAIFFVFWRCIKNKPVQL